MHKLPNGPATHHGNSLAKAILRQRVILKSKRKTLHVHVALQWDTHPQLQSAPGRNNQESHKIEVSLEEMANQLQQQKRKAPLHFQSKSEELPAATEQRKQKGTLAARTPIGTLKKKPRNVFLFWSMASKPQLSHYALSRGFLMIPPRGGLRFLRKYPHL